MKNTEPKNYINITQNTRLDLIIDKLENGVVLFISDEKQNYTLEFFIGLIKALSEKYLVGLINTNKTLGHNKLFETLNISQADEPSCSLKDVEYAVKRWVEFYENPMIIINDVASLHSDIKSENESIITAHKRIRSGLHQIALQYNIAMVGFYGKGAMLV